MTELPAIPHILTPVDSIGGSDYVTRLENDHEDAVYDLYTSEEYNGDIPVAAFVSVAMMNLHKRLKHARPSHIEGSEEVYTRLTFGDRGDFLDLSLARMIGRIYNATTSAQFADWQPTKLDDEFRFKVFDLTQVSNANDPLAAIAVKLTIGKSVLLDKEVSIVGRNYGIVHLNDLEIEEHERSALKILSLKDKEFGSDHYNDEAFSPFEQHVRAMIKRATMQHGGLSVVPVVESLYASDTIKPPVVWE